MSQKDSRVATFRIDSDKWSKFMAWCDSNNTDASKELKRHIDSLILPSDVYTVLHDRNTQGHTEDPPRGHTSSVTLSQTVRQEIDESLKIKELENKINQLEQSPNNNDEVLSLKLRLDELEKKLQPTVKKA